MPSWLANLGKKQPTAPASNGLTGGVMPTYNLPNNGGGFNLSGLEGLQPTNPALIQGGAPQVPVQSYMGQPQGPVPNFTPQTSLSATGDMPIINPQGGGGSGYQGGNPEGTIDPNAGAKAFMEKYRIGNTPPETSTGANQIYANWMKERNTNTGMFALPEDVSLTPEHMRGIRKAADEYYSGLLSSTSEAEKNAATLAKTNAENNPVVSDYSSDHWMQGLVINGLVQGGTVAERKAHEAMLAKLPSEQKQQLIKSSLYNSMSTGERATFDTGDNLAAGVNQIYQDMDNDFRTNPLINMQQNFGGYLGGKQDPKYLSFQAMVGNLSAPIINQIYGAAVTGSELARAKKFIPDLATDTTAMAMTKLQHLAGFYDYANASKLARKAGVPMTETMDDYLAKYDPAKKGKSTSSGPIGWGNILD